MEKDNNNSLLQSVSHEVLLLPTGKNLLITGQFYSSIPSGWGEGREKKKKKKKNSNTSSTPPPVNRVWFSWFFKII